MKYSYDELALEVKENKKGKFNSKLEALNALRKEVQYDCEYFKESLMFIKERRKELQYLKECLLKIDIMINKELKLKKEK